MTRWDAEDFGGSENTWRDTLLMETCHYKFVQTNRMHNTESEQ